MATASQGLRATAAGGGVTGRLDAGRSSTGDAHGDISPSTYRGGIYSTDERGIREEINFITSPLYILARNIFQRHSLQLNKQGQIEIMETSMNSVRRNSVPLSIRRESSIVLGWSKRLDERFPVHLQGPS
jgi:hypothetical protein